MTINTPHGPYPSETCSLCNDLARRAGYTDITEYLQQQERTGTTVLDRPIEQQVAV